MLFTVLILFAVIVIGVIQIISMGDIIAGTRNLYNANIFNDPAVLLTTTTEQIPLLCGEILTSFKYSD